MCRIKAKTTKILKCIKTLLTVKTCTTYTIKIYTTFCCQQQLDHVYNNIVYNITTQYSKIQYNIYNEVYSTIIRYATYKK